MLLKATSYICLFITLFVGTTGYAESRCDQVEFPPVAGSTGYQPRLHGTERCEGLYRSKISSGFEIISFTQANSSTDNEILKISIPQGILPASTQVNIVGSSLQPSIYYRMDSTFNAGDNFLWPLADVVKQIAPLKNQLGVVVWLEQKGRTVVIPAIISNNSAKSAPPVDSKYWGHITLRSPVDVEAVYLYKQGDPDGHEILLEKQFSARQAIEIAIPRWEPQFKNKGLLLVELELKPTADDDWIPNTISIQVGTP